MDFNHLDDRILELDVLTFALLCTSDPSWKFFAALSLFYRAKKRWWHDD